MTAPSPPPIAPTAAAKFDVGDEVRTISDTTSGVHYTHSEPVYGIVVLVSHDADGCYYRIQAADCGRKVTQSQ